MLTQLHEIGERIPQGLIESNSYHRLLTSPGTSAQGIKNFFTLSLDKDGMPASCVPNTKEEFRSKKILKQSNHCMALFVKGDKVFASVKDHDDVQPTEELGKDVEKHLFSKASAIAEDIEEVDAKHPISTILSEIASCEDPAAWGSAAAKLIVDTLKKLDIPSDELLKSYLVLERKGSKKVHTLESYRSFTEQMRSAPAEGNFVDPFGVVGDKSEQTWKNISPSPIKGISPYSRDANTPAFAMYGKKSIEAFAVTTETQAKISAAFETLMSEDARGKICDVQTAGDGGHFITIIAPLEPVNGDKSMSEESKKCAEILMGFGSQKEEDKEVENTAIYLSKGESVVNALRADVIDHPGCEYMILSLLQKGDGGCCVMGMAQVGFEHLANRLDWLRGVWASAPSFDFKKKNKEGQTEKWAESMPVVLTKAHALLNRNWTKGCGLNGDGSYNTDYGDKIWVKQFGPTEAVNAWLYQDKSFADKALRHFGRHHAHLLINVASRLCRWESPILYRERRDILQLPSLATFLYALKGQTMDEVKETIPYLIGRALAQADRLHKAWCLKQNKSLPSKLVGESYVKSFMSGRSIRHGYNNFTNRASVFQGWASREMAGKKPDDRPDVHWPLVTFSSSLKKIAAQGGVPNSLSEEDRSALSLGYFSNVC